ncbi:MAG: hypothetical protein ACM3SS_00540 [Rhodospirillaceae bacterium]
MRTLALAAAVAVTACTAPLPRTPPAGQPSEVAAPTVRTGETLRYVAHDGYTGLPRGTTTYRVIGIHGDDVNVAVRHDNRAWTERYTKDWNWRERPMTNLQNFRYDPPYAALPFPLAAGKTWRTYVNATDPATGRTNRVRIDGEVLGWERVKVPAGEFDTLKVRRYVYAGNAAFFKTEERIVEHDWYAPQLAAIVRSEAKSEHFDNSMNCKGQCNLVRGDWIVMELAGSGG